MKSLYRGVFNLRLAFPVKYAYANSPKQARMLMVRQIAKEQGVLPQVVFKYLKDNPEHFEIKLEIEWKEDAGDVRQAESKTDSGRDEVFAKGPGVGD